MILSSIVPVTPLAHGINTTSFGSIWDDQSDPSNYRIYRTLSWKAGSPGLLARLSGFLAAPPAAGAAAAAGEDPAAGGGRGAEAAVGGGVAVVAGAAAAAAAGAGDAIWREDTVDWIPLDTP